MHHAWPHRHCDGSIHYTHCCAEVADAPAVVARVLPGPQAGSRLHATAGAALAALGLATLAFWMTMLSAPPVSRAALPARADLCGTAGHGVRVAMAAEVARRARVGSAPGQAAFNQLLLWTQAAETACAAGRTAEAQRAFASLERLLAARAVPATEEE
ncbi:hypothetical protein [Methylobacterium sp. JK268]